MIITISIKPHLKRFILKYYNTEEPLKIDSTEYLGDAFTSLGLALNRSKRLGYTNKEYSETLDVQLNFELKNTILGERDYFEINNRLEKIFKSTMYQWALAYTHARSFAAKGIRDFLKYYRVDTLVSQDSAYRAWMRYHHREYEREMTAVS